MKTFIVEFLCFPGLEVHCKLCNELIKDRQEETIIPTLSLSGQYWGPICNECYKDLPRRVNSSRLQKFEG
jgi:hypothetical protein